MNKTSKTYEHSMLNEINTKLFKKGNLLILKDAKFYSNYVLLITSVDKNNINFLKIKLKSNVQKFRKYSHESFNTVYINRYLEDKGKIIYMFEKNNESL